VSSMSVGRNFVALAAVLITLLFGTAVAAENTTKPNIVLLLIDDWAWNGSPVPMDDGIVNSGQDIPCTGDLYSQVSQRP
jgi:hypothetical protein